MPLHTGRSGCTNVSPLWFSKSPLWLSLCFDLQIDDQNYP